MSIPFPWRVDRSIVKHGFPQMGNASTDAWSMVPGTSYAITDETPARQHVGYIRAECVEQFENLMAAYRPRPNPHPANLENAARDLGGEL